MHKVELTKEEEEIVRKVIARSQGIWERKTTH